MTRSSDRRGRDSGAEKGHYDLRRSGHLSIRGTGLPVPSTTTLNWVVGWVMTGAVVISRPIASAAGVNFCSAAPEHIALRPNGN